MTNFLNFDKKMRTENFKLPNAILQDREVHEEYWKNVPLAVISSIQALNICQDNISRIIPLLATETKNKT